MSKHFFKLLFTFLIYNQSVFSQNNSSVCVKTESKFENTGDVLQHAVPITAGLMTILNKDFEGSKQFIFSYSTTIILSYSLKNAIQKQRPVERQQTDSFPSGHTSAAFSGASFIQQRYGWSYGIPAYVLAGVVGVSRVTSCNHDYWDVLGGAVVGIASTQMYSTSYKEKDIKISFLSDKDYHLVSVTYNF